MREPTYPVPPRRPLLDDTGTLASYAAGLGQPARYFSAKFQRQAVKLGPCQLYLTKVLDEVLETILGSCVAACIRDPVSAIAGMNHFMLPTSTQPRTWDSADALRYGNHAMDALIEGLMLRGAHLDRLEIKIFGGANVMSGPTVGDANAEWVLRYLESRSLTVTAQHLGGVLPRSLHYFPATGVVLMQRIDSTGHTT
jgi:chemotaxis protein CheD